MLVFDGYVRVEDRRTNALVAQVFAACLPAGNRLVQRYRPKSWPPRFRLLGKPELLFESDPPFDRSDSGRWMPPLHAGIAEHEHGGRYWGNR